jgi:hypothetical protein
MEWRRVCGKTVGKLYAVRVGPSRRRCGEVAEKEKRTAWYSREGGEALIRKSEEFLTQRRMRAPRKTREIKALGGAQLLNPGGGQGHQIRGVRMGLLWIVLPLIAEE